MRTRTHTQRENEKIGERTRRWEREREDGERTRRQEREAPLAARTMLCNYSLYLLIKAQPQKAHLKDMAKRRSPDRCVLIIVGPTSC